MPEIEVNPPAYKYRRDCTGNAIKKEIIIVYAKRE
jgi:hypothetical protein